MNMIQTCCKALVYIAGTNTIEFTVDIYIYAFVFSQCKYIDIGPGRIRSIPREPVLSY